LILVLPFIALLVPAFYAHAEPALFGFPFFYWYQFAWLVATSALTALVYRLTR
jgi:Protein of unknown function (DUF3311)